MYNGNKYGVMDGVPNRKLLQLDDDDDDVDEILLRQIYTNIT